MEGHENHEPKIALSGWGIESFKTMIYCYQNFQLLNSGLWGNQQTNEVYMSDLQAVNIWLGQFFEMFHTWELRIKLLKFYDGSQSVPIFYIEKSLFLGAVNHCFGNKSQTDPSPWHCVFLNFRRQKLVPFDSVTFRKFSKIFIKCNEH